jgi:DNA polymerase-3 subunit gamma/tau
VGRAALRATTAPAIAVPASAAHVPAFVATALGERWAEIVARLLARGAVTALARELASQAGLLHIDDTCLPPVWQLCVERDSLRTDALRDKLCAALQAELGAPCALVLQAGVPEDTPARRDALERERRQSQAEATMRNDPLVLELMSRFKSARLVPGSIKPI